MKKEMKTHGRTEEGDTESKKGVSIVSKLSNPIQFYNGHPASSGDGVYR